MNIASELKVSLNSEVINDEVFTKLAENAFAVLGGGKEIYDISTLSNSQSDVVIKQAYESLLKIALEFVRDNWQPEDVKTILNSEFLFTNDRAAIFNNLYLNNNIGLQISLSNIGSHLPHVINCCWKIDYTVTTSNNMSQSEGPIFRICLLTEVFHQVENKKTVEYVNFSCTSQQLQDLVYKLKEAVRHCRKLAVEH